jgi:branched-chain amino acid transport system substrate-binding protein
VIVGVLVIVGGCKKLGDDSSKQGSGTQTGSGTGGSAPATGPIKIGHYGSITGAEATFGNSTDQGIKLAVKERNAAGGVKGRKIELITADTASKASEGGTVVTRLIDKDGVVALLGEVASKISLAGGAVAQAKGVPMITPSSTNIRVTEIGPMIFRVCFTDDFQAWVVAKFMRDQKIDKAAILYDQQQPYSKGLADDFQKSFTAMGGKVVASEQYTGGNPDVSAQLQTIKTSSAQAVFLPGYYSDVANYLKQAKTKGIKVPFVGADGWDSTDLVKIGGDAVEGHYYSNHYSHEEKRPEVVSFVASFKKEYGQVPDGLAALGYDAARVLFDAMDRAASLDGQTLAAAIAATKDFAGVTGKITIDPKRNAQKKAVILKMKDGVPTMFADIWPEGMEPTPTTAPSTGSGSAAEAGNGSSAMKDEKSADGDKMTTRGKDDIGGADTGTPKKKGGGAAGGGGTKEGADPDDGGE